MAIGGEGFPPCPGRENICLSVGLTNVNGLSVLKRRELVQSFEGRRKVERYRVTKTYKRLWTDRLYDGE